MQFNTERGFSTPSGHRSDISQLSFAAVFAGLTYLAISVRAVLSPYEVHHLIDAKRILSVMIGAIILWFAIRAAERRFESSFAAQIFAMLHVAVPGTIGLLLARELYDLAAYGEFAQRLSLNLRWMLTWIGYFAAAAAIFVALRTHRQLQIALSQSSNAVGAKRNLIEANNRRLPQHDLDASRVLGGYETADVDYDPRLR